VAKNEKIEKIGISILELKIPEKIKLDLSRDLIKFVKNGKILEKIVKLSFLNPELTPLIVKNVFKNERASALNFYSNFGIKNQNYISGALTMIKILMSHNMTSSDEFDVSCYITGLVGMTSSDRMSRELGHDVIRLSGSDDVITKRILKKKSEILADPDQLKQILNRKLKSIGTGSDPGMNLDDLWPIIKNLKKIKNFELEEIIKLVDRKFISDYFLTQLGLPVDGSTSLPVYLFRLLPTAKQETINRIKPEIEVFLNHFRFDDAPEVYLDSISSLVSNCFCFEVAEIGLVRKILEKSKILGIKSAKIANAAKFHISELKPEVLSLLITGNDSSTDDSSVIKVMTS